MDSHKPERGTLKVKGGLINFEAKLGESPPSLLIHPAVSDSRIWDRELHFNSIGKSLIRYDTRGLGKSTPASSEYFPSDDIQALLDHLGVEKASLVAASNGGMAALDFVHRFPDRTDKLVLLASGIELFDPEGEGGIQETVQDFIQKFDNVNEAWKSKDTKLSVDRLIDLFASSVHGSNLELARKMIQENLKEIITDESAKHQKYEVTSEKLAGISIPTLIVVGTSDHPIFKWSAGKLKEYIKGSRLLEIKGADHLINLSAPREFDINIGKFLGK